MSGKSGWTYLLKACGRRPQAETRTGGKQEALMSGHLGRLVRSLKMSNDLPLRAGEGKQPMFITLKSGVPMGFAGLWENVWSAPVLQAG
jgi:hypothetical protein